MDSWTFKKEFLHWLAKSHSAETNHTALYVYAISYEFHDAFQPSLDSTLVPGIVMLSGAGDDFVLI